MPQYTVEVKAFGHHVIRKVEAQTVVGAETKVLKELGVSIKAKRNFDA